MAADTKQRMVEAAALSLRQRGLAATSFTEVLAASGAARGGIYHHFPGGKEDLAEQAVEWTGCRVREELESIEASDPAAILYAFVDRIRPVVAKAASGTSCAVAAVAMETSPERGVLSIAAATAFRSWINALEKQLVRSGLPLGQARATAQLMIAFLEGSLVLARATGGVEMFEESAPMFLRTLTR